MHEDRLRTRPQDCREGHATSHLVGQVGHKSLDTPGFVLTADTRTQVDLDIAVLNDKRQRGQVNGIDCLGRRPAVALEPDLPVEEIGQVRSDVIGIGCAGNADKVRSIGQRIAT